MDSNLNVWEIALDASKDDTVVQTSEARPGVFIVTMNSPQNHNILTPLMMGAVTRAIDRLSAKDPEKITVIILAASGRSFCAGVDINAIREEPNLTKYWTRKVDPFLAVQQSPVPIIACVQGPAMTGGFELALGCDIVIASSDAVFRDNHAMYGVFQLRGLSQILSRICGPSNAKLASLASLPITASRALAWNIVSEVVETPKDLLPAALHIAEGLVYNKGPILRAMKKAMNDGYTVNYQVAREVELKSSERYFESLGNDVPRILQDGADRFNRRVKELDSGCGMRGGIAGEE